MTQPSPPLSLDPVSDAAPFASLTWTGAAAGNAFVSLVPGGEWLECDWEEYSTVVANEVPCFFPLSQDNRQVGQASLPPHQAEKGTSTDFIPTTQSHSSSLISSHRWYLGTVDLVGG